LTNISILHWTENEFDETVAGIKDKALFLVQDAGTYLSGIMMKWVLHFAMKRKNEVEVGYILSDVNKNTYYMTPTGKNTESFWIPGISINGSVGDEIKSEIKNGRTVVADFTLVQNYNESVESYNVIGTINATKKENRDKIVVIEGHYDSWWGQFTIDNAVGAATVFGIAKYIADNKDILDIGCTLKFIAFCCEEVGLYGSKSYVESHKDELKNLQCVINLDTFAVKANIPFHIRYYDDKVDVELTLDLLKIIRDAGYHDSYLIIPDKSKLKRSDTFAFIDLTDRFIYIDKYADLPWRNSFYYQRSGEEHTVGDCINILDRDDLNVSAEVVLGVTKYFGGVTSKRIPVDYTIIILILTIVIILIAIVIWIRKFKKPPIKK